MSLQAAAQLLADKGRGPDSTLVHMSPREVKSLQELAMAHGGSLSVNPSTGLPEAGFLDNLLPMIIGAGVTAATGGAAAPWMVGLGVGGFEALRTGDLGKGLMAGLGAYGGAGLMGGLVGAGTEAAANAASEGMAGVGQNTLEAARSGTAMTQAQADAIQAARAKAIAAAENSPFSTAIQGAKSIWENPNSLQALGTNISTGFGSSPLMKLGTTAAAAAAPALLAQPEANFQPAKPEEVPIYSYAPNATSPTPQPNVPRPIDYRNFVPGQTVSPQSQRFGAEQRYFNPMFTQTGTRTIQPAQQPEEDDGGFLGLFANGGAVEQMSQANSVGANTGYPQADIRGHAYATPWQTPVAQNMVTGVADTGVNPITGEMSFADGGITGEGNLDLHIPLDFGGGGGFGGASANGYQVAGSGTSAQTGFRGYNNAPGQSTGATRQDMSSFAPTSAADAFAQMATAGQTGAPNSTTDAGAAAAFTGLGPIGNQAGLSSRLSNYVSDPTRGGGINLQGKNYFAQGGVARWGLSDLGGYSDGGRLLKGPGDGVSDSIPAMIGKKQPARLADGEFVVPARIVSELGNGSTEAGARKLYAMMDRIQAGRKKTMGKGKAFAKDSKADRHLPA